jgi:uncharacterized membrane protein
MGGKKTAGVVIREAWELIKANYKTLFIAVLIIYGAVFLYEQLLNQLIVWLGLSQFSKTNPVITIVRSLLLIIGETFLINSKAVTIVILKGDTPGIRKTVKQFGRNWERYLGIQVWSILWTYLWSLLFFIPGIVKYFSYMLAPYLVIDYPDMTVTQSLKKSMEITKGYKGRLFLLALLAYVPIVPGTIFSFVMAMQHITQYQLYVTLYGFIANLLLVQPLSNMMFGVAYLDIKKAAIKNHMLPPDTDIPHSPSAGFMSPQWENLKPR